jgi:hypothetical protein
MDGLHMHAPCCLRLVVFQGPNLSEWHCNQSQPEGSICEPCVRVFQNVQSANWPWATEEWLRLGCVASFGTVANPAKEEYMSMRKHASGGTSELLFCATGIFTCYLLYGYVQVRWSPAWPEPCACSVFPFDGFVPRPVRVLLRMRRRPSTRRSPMTTARHPSLRTLC